MPNFGNYHQVSGAGWSVYWKIPMASGGGLEVWWADFQGHRVMWRGSQPFALVPYHGGSPTYKDGLDAHCGGAPFTALKHTAPNSWAPWLNPGPYVAGVDTDAVVVKTDPGDDFNPGSLTIAAKFQCGWYQYVHSWEFSSDGVIAPRVAMGGHIHPSKPDIAHVHHMYFRLDLDIDGQFPHDVIEVFNHINFNQPGGDKWARSLPSESYSPIQTRLVSGGSGAPSPKITRVSSRATRWSFHGWPVAISTQPATCGPRSIEATAFCRGRMSVPPARTRNWKLLTLWAHCIRRPATTSLCGSSPVRITNPAATARSLITCPTITRTSR